MAAFGILAALRERDGGRPGRPAARARARSSTSRWPTARSPGSRWSPARYFADGTVPQPRRAPAGRLADLLPALRVRRRLGRAGRAGAQVLAGVVPRRGARGADREAVRAARLRAPTRRCRRSSSARTRAEWEEFAAKHDCCLEPVLELDEALDSELVRAREMVVEIEQPGCRPRRAPARASPSSSPARPASTRACRARRSASTPRRCCARPATPRPRWPGAAAGGAVAGPAAARARTPRSGRERPRSRCRRRPASRHRARRRRARRSASC